MQNESQIRSMIQVFRREAGLSPSKASEDVWVERVMSGKIGINDVEAGIQASLDRQQSANVTFNQAQQTSAQTGSTGGDSAYITPEQVRERVAAIRSGRGLSPDPISDEEWVRRITSNQASIGDARTAITARANEMAQENAAVIDVDIPRYQTGSAPGDNNIDTEDEYQVRQRIADIRAHRNLPDDPASDDIWVSRIASGKATWAEAREAISDKAYGRTVTEDAVSVEAVLEDIKNMREQAGLSADADADQTLANQIMSGEKGIADVRRELLGQTRENIASAVNSIRNELGVPAQSARDDGFVRDVMEGRTTMGDIRENYRNIRAAAMAPEQPAGQPSGAPVAQPPGSPAGEGGATTSEGGAASGPQEATAYNGSSIVEFLNSQGEPSSYSARVRQAVELGMGDYSGTEEENTALLNHLRSGTPIPSHLLSISSDNSRSPEASGWHRPSDNSRSPEASGWHRVATAGAQEENDPWAHGGAAAAIVGPDDGASDRSRTDYGRGAGTSSVPQPQQAEDSTHWYARLQSLYRGTVNPPREDTIRAQADRIAAASTYTHQESIFREYEDNIPAGSGSTTTTTTSGGAIVVPGATQGLSGDPTRTEYGKSLATSTRPPATALGTVKFF